ncbi:acyl-CoA dehydrogenase [Sporichthya brevicatena]|uniref:Acyl-CoA dehydrogenase n=1 Tax=Sporichthya brevicatena TaxID=171442 RepID=A0ABN1G415_9ACTN
MSIALTDDHRDLAGVVRKLLADRGAAAAARALLDADVDAQAPFWSELAGLDLLGLHVDAENGGAGYSLLETAIVVEEAGRAIAPGSLLPTVWASAVLAAAGGSAVLPDLATGKTVGAVGIPGRDGSWLVLGGELAEVFLLPVDGDIVVADRDSVSVTPSPSLDRTRRTGRLRLHRDVGELPRLAGAAAAAVALGRALAAAEASGIATACLQMATEYVKIREQFGRPVGTYQAVKHHAANMLVDVELATAAAWNAARSLQGIDRPAELAAAIASTLALPAAVRCAQVNIQLHGGIGFTWEHDAHLYLRRAATLVALFGPAETLAAEVTHAMAAGVTLRTDVELPPEAEQIRETVRAFRREVEELPAEQRHDLCVARGFAVPSWPEPWGRGAGPVEQIVINQELAGLDRHDYEIGGWLLRTILAAGTEEQIQRFLPRGLSREDRWCQLFSEPGAGSDVAAASTRAVRTAGGWILNGQKVWTTFGTVADRGLATVRTDPDAPKRKGITIMLIDMHAPGVDVRPLREATGDAMFAEVFLTDVFVPDADVLGAVNEGWKVVISALANERSDIGGRTTDGPVALLDLHRRYGDQPGAAAGIGALLAEQEGIALLNLRVAERAVAGSAPGSEGNVSKLLFTEHHQRVADLGLALAGPEAALSDGCAGDIAHALMWTRLLTIGGGTAEIVRNTIAERILGLPRDPLMD